MCPRSARRTRAAACSAGCAKTYRPLAGRCEDFRGAHMVATLFYVDTVPETGSLAILDGDEGFHAATVRRIRPGEQRGLADGAGKFAHCEVERAGRGGLRARVLRRWSVEPGRPAVTVVQ